ncbi:MAG: replication initiation protein [Rickettsiaceae bacterium]|nr:replication initiation protein [Rickettsiaceae bacterium]
MALSKIETQSILKKHVNAVHCSNNMSLLQRKAANVLLANAYNDLPYKNEFQIDIKTLCILMGFNSKNMSKLRESLKALTATVIEWGILDEYTDINDINWGISSALASISIKGGVCKYEYSNALKQLLYHPEIYARVNLSIQSKFKSSYALALYENCARYRDINQTPWFELQELKKILGAFGAGYHHYGSFKKRVLDIAIDEVNKISDFNIEILCKKENRAVTHIKFKISQINDHPPEQIEEEATNKDNITNSNEIKSILIQEFNIKDSIVDKIVIEFGPQYILKQIALFRLIYKDREIKNLAGALLDMIKNPDKYSEPLSSNKIAHDKLRLSQNKQAIERRKRQEQEELSAKYAEYLQNKVFEYLQGLDEDSKGDIRAEFEEFCQRKENITVISMLFKSKNAGAKYNTSLANLTHDTVNNWKLVPALAKKYLTIFMTSHYLKDKVMSKGDFVKFG